MMRIIVSIIILFSIARSAPAEILWQDDFEYGQDYANISALAGNSTFTTRWPDERQESTGTISVQSTYAHGGSRALYMEGVSQTNAFISHNITLRDELWVSMWIRPDYGTADGKLIYTYDNLSGAGGGWVLKYQQDYRWTGVCATGSANQQDFGGTGWSLHYLGPGGATNETGLENLANGIATFDQWTRYVLHVDASDGTVELWVDTGSGLTKTGDRTVSGTACDPGGTLRFKLILLPQSSSAAVYIDDFIAGTTAADVGIGSSPSASATIHRATSGAAFERAANGAAFE